MSETQKPPIALSTEGFGKYVDGDSEELVESETIEQGSGWKLVREEWHVTRFRIVAEPDAGATHTNPGSTSSDRELPFGRS